ncbi:ankyrin repeat domain-containing protein [uncultured Roseovarius sp.]|uniref:ankyrin repeat domain-containing protein n=1 Tax=uncultured Roseovarius sp. TaxID=293344 RepID=UPI002625345F|nr:ankyrin repeat domain-containing protein [uncultured Roseovarius sp.]
MAITPLPANPNLENLKKRAKTLLKSVQAGDAQAAQQVGPYFGDPRAISLQQAQLVIARSHGFSSWTRLKRHVEGARDEGADQLANRFLDLVTVAYGSVPDFGPARFEQARELLTEHPEIAQDSIYTAAAIGDVAGIDHWLDQQPDLINKKGGFFGWEPLMYAAYGRLPGTSTYAAGLRLLERGADPDAYYMWGGQYKFTALTGVFGQGEGGPVNQPEHPDYVAFARAMLERGANPNDSQAAYNRSFEPDDTCLELLLEYGLSASDKNNWLLVEDDKLLPHPSDTLHFQLISAIKRGFADRVSLLVAHGVDLNKPDETYDTRTKGKTPYQAALLMGEGAIASMLAEAGAEQRDLSPEEAFQVACMAGDLTEAQAILKRSGDDLPGLRRTDMLRDAARRGNREALEVMIALGFDLNGLSGNSALHEAVMSEDVGIAELLLEAGADPTLRDLNYYATPMGYALHMEDAAMIALLDRCRMDIFTAAARGNLDQIRARLVEDPTRLDQRFADICPGDVVPENGWTTPLVFAVASDHPEAVRLLLEAGADMTVTDGKGGTVWSVAEAQAGDGVRAVLAEFQSREV